MPLSLRRILLKAAIERLISRALKEGQRGVQLTTKQSPVVLKRNVLRAAITPTSRSPLKESAVFVQDGRTRLMSCPW